VCEREREREREINDYATVVLISWRKSNLILFSSVKFICFCTRIWPCVCGWVCWCLHTLCMCVRACVRACVCVINDYATVVLIRWRKSNLMLFSSVKFICFCTRIWPWPLRLIAAVLSTLKSDVCC